MPPPLTSWGDTLTHWSLEDATWGLKITWLQAVAQAWANPEFETALLADPRKVFQEQLSFTLPPGVDFKVVKSADQSTDAYDGKSHAWMQLTNPMLVLVLPNKPTNPELQAVALADYSSYARVYPFSTCC